MTPVSRVRLAVRLVLPAAGALSLLAAAPAIAASPATGAGAPATPVSLPRDEGPHHDAVEWWYFNGHLSGTDPAGMVRSYGFELVTFQFRLFGPTPVYVGNFAVTDLGRKAFHYASATGPSSQPQSPGRFSLSTGTWTMSGSSGDDTLRAAMPGYSIDLAQHSTEPAALEGPGGTISLGPLGPAHYYSWTSLATSGTMVDHGVSLRVTGRSWMDHEWSNTLSGAAGWDWFSVQLDNGTQYMLQFIRTKRAGIVAASGTRVRAAGVDYLTKGRIGEQASGSWTSPVTGYTYARHWRLRVPGGDLEVAPLLADQEVDLRKVQGTVYWEGDCVITGTIGGKPVTGVGYTEINPPGQLG